MNKKQIGAAVSVILLLLVTTIGLSFAYFTANLSGGETATTIEVNGGVMSIVYADHNPNIEVNDIIPDNNPAAVKSFTVTGTNSTDLEMGYGVSLVVNENTFSNGAISYTLESTNSGANGQTATSIVTNKPIKTGEGTYKLGQGYFTNGTGKVHSYELKIYFLETGNLQNEDQGKTFKAHVGITDAPKVACPNQLTPAQVGDNVYATLVGDTLTVSGTGEIWDFTLGSGSSYDNVLMRIGANYFGNKLYYFIFLAMKTEDMSREDFLSMSQTEMEGGIEQLAPDSDLTYQDVIDFINAYDFENCGFEVKDLNLVIEEGITRVGIGAFDQQYITVSLPNSLEEIGEAAFRENDFKTVTIPNNVRVIDYRAFSYCSIETLILGSGVEEIGGSAFYGHKLTTLTIPASVTSIGSSAFSTSQNTLTSVTVLGANPQRFNANWSNIGFGDVPTP